ncbi:MAG: type I-U CRISPR-associated protein Cas8c [Chthoniobacterales bacterium]
MSEARVPVDLFNPGQVFACLGLVELAAVLHGAARGGFDWNNDADVQFVLSSEGDECPVRAVIDFLRAAEVRSVSPSGSDLTTAKWNVPTSRSGLEKTYPFSEPDSPATLSALLICGDQRICISHWGEEAAKTGLDAVKFWAGSGGYPGAALARDAITLLAEHSLDEQCANPFNLGSVQTGSFRLEWRRDYVPLEIGFSLNRHAMIKPIGYPLVEILGAIGLSHARPKKNPQTKLEYEYGALAVGSARTGEDAVFLRAALGGAQLPFDIRRFLMKLDWPGQENQARCIMTVEEIA